jgi:ABC-type branched-subunit amino acid transport system ATPase component
LIGPNGAGKTTTFNACTGLNRRFSGAIEFHGTDVTRKTMSARARSGLGRTFQRFELCDELTVFENVRLGYEAGQGGGRAFSQILASRQQAREGTQAACAALEQCGIAGLATTIVGTLSTGERRLVELARCLAGPFDLLLLDEPSSGLERSQSEAFGQLLRTIVETRGVGILLVEHDVELVLSLCSYIYVLDFGQMLYSGTPVEVAGSEVVQAAYLGSKSLLTTDQAR